MEKHKVHLCASHHDGRQQSIIYHGAIVTPTKMVIARCDGRLPPFCSPLLHGDVLVAVAALVPPREQGKEKKAVDLHSDINQDGLFALVGTINLNSETAARRNIEMSARLVQYFLRLVFVVLIAVAIIELPRFD